MRRGRLPLHATYFAEKENVMAGRDPAFSRRTALVAMMGVGGLCRRTARAAEPTPPKAGAFRAGACAIDISPKKLPVIVSGSFFSRTANAVRDPLHARCLVLDDGTARVAIVVVDTLAMSREMLDEVKQKAQKATGILPERMLISATHTHSAPSVMGALGTGVDEAYCQYLPGRLVESIEKAAGNLEPARVGWAVIDAPDHTHCRRWIFRPDKMRTDPFGQRNVRAHMHPGYQNPACVGPSGPPDPQLSMLAVQTADGRPIALLANYSMHYYGAGAVSADYYGEFCRAFTRLVGAEKQAPPFVAMMSHGTSGDLHWMDYGKPKNSPGLPRYAASLAELAHQACQKIEYHGRAPIRMAETKLTLGRRLPDEKRLAWAKDVLAKMGDRLPKNWPEVYAREAMYLHEEPTRELILQALRIGDFGITAIPNEVYGLTGLKLKALSPLEPTMNIELANGCEGYIPPPALHPLGGYNTWPARTAGLEVQAEPKITEAVLGLLEKVAERPRRKPITPQGAYAKAVLASKPLAYWRMGEFDGPRATDASRHSHHGTYEEGVVFYLEGPESPQFCGEGRSHRAAHFAGGRMKASLKGLATTYSVELWFWNGMPTGARPVTGYLFSWGPDGDKSCPGDHLGIGGTHSAQGKLFFFNGNRCNEGLGGSTEIALRTWNHVVLVREGKRVTVYLNGNPTPEIASEAAVSLPPDAREVFLGGRCDNLSNWEGKVCEAAIYGRALSADEVGGHYKAAAAQPS